MSRLTSQVEWRLPVGIRYRDIGSIAQQVLQGLEVAFLSRHVQGRSALPVWKSEGSSRPDQIFHRVDLSGFNCQVQRCLTILVPNVQRCATSNEEPNRVKIPFLCRNVQMGLPLVVLRVWMQPASDVALEPVEISM